MLLIVIFKGYTQKQHHNSSTYDAPEELCETICSKMSTSKTLFSESETDSDGERGASAYEISSVAGDSRSVGKFQRAKLAVKCSKKYRTSKGEY